MLLALCSGYVAFGYSNDMSHLAASTIVESLYSTLEKPPIAIPQAFAAARDSFTHYSDDFDEFDLPAGCVLCAIITDTQAYIGWIGSVRALHIRNNQIINSTKPHTVADLHPNLELPEHMKHSATRYLTFDTIIEENIKLVDEPWQLQSEDKLVFLTGELAKYLSLPQIPNLIQNQSVRDATRILLETGCTGDDHWNAAAIVVGFQSKIHEFSNLI